MSFKASLGRKPRAWVLVSNPRRPSIKGLFHIAADGASDPDRVRLSIDKGLEDEERIFGKKT